MILQSHSWAYYLEKNMAWKDTCTPTFTAVLFTIARTWKTWMSINRWMDKQDVLTIAPPGKLQQIRCNRKKEMKGKSNWKRQDLSAKHIWQIARVQLQQQGIQPEGVSSAGKKLRQPLSFLGLPVYFKLMILLYTFTKALGQRFDIFSSHRPRFIFLQKSFLPLKRSSFLSDSYLLFLMCPCEYTVTHANVWAAYHIPQFISYFLSPVCP